MGGRGVQLSPWSLLLLYMLYEIYVPLIYILIEVHCICTIYILIEVHCMSVTARAWVHCLKCPCPVVVKKLILGLQSKMQSKAYRKSRPYFF